MPHLFTEILTARFTPDERARIEYAAAFYKMSVNALLRAIVLQWLNSSPSSFSNSSNNINVEKTPTSKERRRQKKGESEPVYTRIHGEPPTPSFPPYSAGGQRMSDEEWAEKIGLNLGRQQAASLEEADRERRRQIDLAKQKTGQRPSSFNHSEPAEEFEDPEED